jgi:hypothetical protein
MKSQVKHQKCPQRRRAGRTRVPHESTRTLRLSSKANPPATSSTPPQKKDGLKNQGKSAKSGITPEHGEAPKNPAHPRTSSCPLLHIADSLERIIAKYSPPGQLRMALSELLDCTKKAEEDERDKTYCVPLGAVKLLHEQ